MWLDFIEAFRGKLQWDALRKKGYDWYLIMPHENDEYNDYALEYLDAFLDKKKSGSAYIVTGDKSVYEKVGKKSWSHKIDAMQATPKWISRIIKFYGLYEFSTKIKIISLSEPYDTGAENLIGVHGVTKKELLCYDIFGLDEIPD